MAWFECVGLLRRPWIEGFDLGLERGEIVVLRAPSGSGKTLLLRSLSELDPRDGGDLLLDGRSVASFPPRIWRTRVRYVHQRPPLLGGTVAEHLETLGALASVAGHTLEAPPGIDPETPARRLSGGEAQRLALATALAMVPDVLLLDEPTSALDVDRARELEAEVQAYVARGRAALWVSHEDGLAERLGAREVSLS